MSTDMDRRIEALRSTAGALTPAEDDDWAKAIEDCERIDESGCIHMKNAW
jgi:hypothetical protein